MTSADPPTGADPHGAEPARPDRGPAPRWPLRLFRTGAGLLALLALVQTTLAGSFLNGHYDSFAAHGSTARAVLAGAAVQLAAAVVLRRTGRGPRWPAALSAVLLLAAVGQSAAGYGRAVGVHVVLGVLLVAGVLLAAVGAWREPLPARRATAGVGGPAADRLPRPTGPREVAR
ncbi:hypothetical protein ACWGB8_16950 [Kitasatospora sp. NPDC054939]